MTDPIAITSVSQIHKLLGLPAPQHSLVTLIESPQTAVPSLVPGVRVYSELYSVSLKSGAECDLFYGRRNYDFQQGTLVFLAPGQSFEPRERDGDPIPGARPGWVLAFHPDLVRGTPVQEAMAGHTFFRYAADEALHISEPERRTVTDIARAIRREYAANQDSHSRNIIAAQIGLLLSYCSRFYGRQFLTRAAENGSAAARFEALLERHCGNDGVDPPGLPSVKACAAELGYSAGYLGDLLKKETGKNARELIHLFLIRQAKNRLLSRAEDVSTVASGLGFEYPQHFAKLFKSKTGLSPSDYRKQKRREDQPKKGAD